MIAKFRSEGFRLGGDSDRPVPKRHVSLKPKANVRLGGDSDRQVVRKRRKRERSLREAIVIAKFRSERVLL